MLLKDFPPPRLAHGMPKCSEPTNVTVENLLANCSKFFSACWLVSVLVRHHVGDLLLNEHAREVQIEGNNINLTGAEFNLITLLVKHAGQVVSRERLAKEGLGRALTAYDRRVETHMAQIRRKLGKHKNGGERIKTVRGAGYQYVINP